MEAKIKILCVDNEEHTLFGMKALFRREYEVFLAQNTIEANKLLMEQKDICMVICDQKMNGQKGTDYLAELKYSYPHIMRILFTGSLETETLFEAINKAAVFKCAQKPLEIEEMKSIITEAHQAYARNKEHIELVLKIIHYNEEMKRLMTKSLEMSPNRL